MNPVLQYDDSFQKVGILATYARRNSTTLSFTEDHKILIYSSIYKEDVIYQVPCRELYDVQNVFNFYIFFYIGTAQHANYKLKIPKSN